MFIGISLSVTQWLGGTGVPIAPPAAGTGEPQGLLLALTAS